MAVALGRIITAIPFGPSALRCFAISKEPRNQNRLLLARQGSLPVPPWSRVEIADTFRQQKNVILFLCAWYNIIKVAFPFDRGNSGLPIYKHRLTKKEKKKKGEKCSLLVMNIFSTPLHNFCSRKYLRTRVFKDSTPTAKNFILQVSREE